MKLRYTIILYIAAVFLMASCSDLPEKTPAQRLSTADADASGPYFTHDNKDNPVLCWTEKDPSDSLYRLKYAVYDVQNNQFLDPVTVTPSRGSNATAESMSKIAFKADGSIIAVFGKRFENEKNPYAGAIYYSMSADEGKNWSEPQFLHSDTVHTYGRSFFDIATLKDGEVAAIWLDGRFGKAEKGSALFFAKTTKGAGFGLDQLLDKSTCECCRTELLVDQTGKIHVAYRSIRYPEALLGKQARDMAYLFSADNGQTFSESKIISNDHWAIEGCPHTGPSLAADKNGLHALWFTAGGNSGLYFSTASEGGRFSPRTLLSAEGRHPQMCSLANGRLALVWEEDKGAHHPAGNEHGNHQQQMGGHNHPAAATASGISLRIIHPGKEDKNIALSDGKQADHHAVISPLSKNLLGAWVREENGRSAVYYSRVKL
ncbi:MAG TPA: sialidase family protein [Daejeonella sp.]|nr:sialidase family protein [Daejeonella sp.]